MTDEDNPFLELARQQIYVPRRHRLPQQKRHGCPYCGRQMIQPEDRAAHLRPPRARTRDHVWPKSRFRATASNFVIYCCNQCNNDKANRTIHEWLAVLEAAGDPRREHVALFIEIHRIKEFFDMSLKGPRYPEYDR